jgi:hypothetical protein
MSVIDRKDMQTQRPLLVRGRILFVSLRAAQGRCRKA